MKKDELVKVIRAIVKQEIKKELPNALAQWFAQTMMGRPTTVGQSRTPEQYIGQALPHKPSAEEMPQQQSEEVDETALLKEQLREMFNGDAPVQRAQPQAPQQPKKQYTNNPLLNEVLNQTRPFNGSERMAMRVGGGGVSPGVMMAAAGYDTPPEPSTTGVGQMMENNDLGFMRNVPGMPGADLPMLTSPPAGQAGAIPMEALGTLSALDIKNHPAVPENIRNILSRDYRSLVRAMDKKK